MRKRVMILLTLVPLAPGIATMEVGERAVSAAAFGVMAFVAALLYRRFRPFSAHVTWRYHTTAAIGLTLGTVTRVAGMNHSAAWYRLPSRKNVG